MVDAKKIEKKIPCLIVKAWWSKEYDTVNYRKTQWKKKSPETYQHATNNVVVATADWEKDLNNWWMQTHKKQRQQ